MRKYLLSALLLLCAVSLHAVGLEEKLALGGGEAIRPTDPKIGELSLVGTGEEGKKAKGLLDAPYGLEWLDTYVDPTLKETFSTLYGDFLSVSLPQKGYLFGQPVKGEGTVSIPLRLANGQYLTLVFRSTYLTGFSLRSGDKE